MITKYQIPHRIPNALYVIHHSLIMFYGTTTMHVVSLFNAFGIHLVFEIW